MLLIGATSSSSGSDQQPADPPPARGEAGVLQVWTPQQLGFKNMRTARLEPSGRAVAPPDAPPRVRRVIAAANAIRNAPYVMGGGHAHFRSKGYDCSGAVSYALHGGGFLRKPAGTSSDFETFGKKGPGRWITVYGMGSHAYAVIAGLRWDTAGTGESGPSWQKARRPDQGGDYAVRHPAGF